MTVDFDKVRKAVHDERRYLHSLRSPTSVTTDGTKLQTTPSFSIAQVNAMLRVEISDKIIDDLVSWKGYPMFIGRPIWDTDREGPVTIDGVAWYTIYGTLPDPGWRIINPMRACPGIRHWARMRRSRRDSCC